MMATDDTCRPDTRLTEAESDTLQLQRQIAHRAKVAAEILETERTYVSGLGLIEKLYIAPLLHSAQQPTAILSRKEVRQLFANFADIITLSRELLSQLEARLGPDASPPWDAETGRLGDIFLSMAPFLKMYSLYLRNFRSALADISRWLGTNQAFAQFIQAANARPECRGLSFQSYMLLPVQRIPRYKLLLEDLLSHTPAGHVDHASIGDALRTIADVATFVNENIEEHEMTLSIIEIQRTLGVKESLLAPGRRLVKVGELTKICRKSHQRRLFYLFSDMLLYSSHAVPLGEDQSGHRRVPLEDCKVMDVPDAHDSRNQFTLISREKSFIVYACSASEKLAWMNALTRAITQQREARDTLQMDSSLKRRIARARRSTMLHFPRVAENFDAPVWDPDESAEGCYICFRDFSLFVRRHHCRACGKIVCNACSRKNIVFVAPDSTDAKEGRGCDQCIARLFGREALESPPGTMHRILSRSRHSLDPGALIQSLSALTLGGGGGTARHVHMDSPIREEEGAGDADNDGDNDAFALPEVAPVVVHGGAAQLSLSPFGFGGAAQLSTGESTPAQGDATPGRPPTPGLSQSPKSVPRAGRLSLMLARRLSKHSSTGSALDWEWQTAVAASAASASASASASGRSSTVLYEASPPAMHGVDAGSPMSTLSHHRVSLVSSSCSTVVSAEPSQRFRRARGRRPPASALAFDADGGSHCSLLALYDGSPAARPSTPLQPALLSYAAPPKLTLVQAEATAARARRAAHSTVCSLCQGCFDIADAQHQCASCLSLVCPRCISHRSLASSPADASATGTCTPGYARMSMYFPEGHDRLSGGLICTSCAARPSSTVVGDGDDDNEQHALFSRAVLTQ
ncbi:hypothetical protein LPJ53_001290 [Coemansia erecta]|uniref:Dbl homology domain-containing protein n=1 Tax=Coemansia erecta TaxID=147472 RepID=A0A9W8CT02_9FUNG|nr:hypothetical protein LPJ53_001290 [Coemansia erecta]